MWQAVSPSFWPRVISESKLSQQSQLNLNMSICPFCYREAKQRLRTTLKIVEEVIVENPADHH